MLVLNLWLSGFASQPCMFIDVNGANKEIDMKVLELSKTDPLGNELKTIDTKLWFKLCCLLHLKLLFLHWISIHRVLVYKSLWMESTRTSLEDGLWFFSFYINARVKKKRLYLLFLDLSNFLYAHLVVLLLFFLAIGCLRSEEEAGDEYQWREFRFEFEEEVKDVEAFSYQLVGMEQVH